MSSSTLARRQYVDFRGNDGGRLMRLPGLDGLRGIAVAGVVVFHADLGVMVGGYLGVSTFFTLSGFLITSLLLVETADSGTVGLRGFWGRRFRRLLPASLVTLALVATVFAWLVATVDQLDGLRAGILSSLAQVANWHFILVGSSYEDLFAAPSPLLHFWSLAIEEQFYLVFPLLVLGLWRATRGRRALIGGAFALLALGSALLPILLTMSRDRVYFGTDTRAAELLLGAVLAVLLGDRRVRRKLVSPTALRTSVLVGAVVLGGIQLWWWWSLEQSAGFLYEGGFALYAAMTCVVITAASLPNGQLRRALSVGPLLWLGERSYGIYLVHWPLFLAIRQSWPDSSAPLRAAVGIPAALVLAELSFRFIEQPIRQRRSPISARFATYATGSILVIAVLAVVALPSGTSDPEGRLDFDAAAAETEALLAEQEALLAERDAEAATSTTAPETADPATTTTVAPVVVPPPSLATFGDSTALLLNLGMLLYSRESAAVVGQGGDADLGCGVSRFAARRLDTAFTPDAKCTAWPERWQAVIDAEQPDIAQLVTASWEITDAQLPGASGFSAIGDPAVDAFIASELNLAVDILGSRGAMVLLVLWPRFSDFSNDGASAGERAKGDPARMERLHEIMRQIAAERPDDVRILDLEALVEDRIQDPALRPDGIHIPAEQALELYRGPLGLTTIALWDEFWRQRNDPASSAQAAPAG